MPRKQLTEYDINRLNKSELRNEVEKLAKRANVRIKELERQDLYTSAYQALEKQVNTKGIERRDDDTLRFSRATANKNVNELRSELSALQKFLTARTSTKTGFQELTEEGYQHFNEKYDSELTREEYDDLWNTEIKSFIDKVGGSDEVVKLVVKDIKKGMTIDEINQKLKETSTIYGYKHYKKRRRKASGKF